MSCYTPISTEQIHRDGPVSITRSLLQEVHVPAHGVARYGNGELGTFVNLHKRRILTHVLYQNNKIYKVCLYS